MARFAGHAYPDGLLVLDTETGEIVFAPSDGSAVKLVRAGLGAQPGKTLAAPKVDAPLSLPPRSASPVSSQGPSSMSEVVRSFPQPIAYAYQRYRAEEDPREACKLLLEAFTAVVKTWALMVVAEYLQTPGLVDAAVNESILRDLQRPLTSVWGVTTLRALECFAARGHKPFAPELKATFEAVETRCRDPFLAEVAYEDEAGSTRTRTSKLGKISALVRFRNSLAHGVALSVDKAREELARHAPLLESILHEARWMGSYTLFALAEPARAGEPVLAYRLSGPERPREPQVVDGVLGDTIDAQMFLLSAKTGAVLPLPVVFELGGRDGAFEPILFEGNTKTTVIYLGASGVRVERQAPMQRWRTLVSAKSGGGRALAAHEITAEALVSAAAKVTREVVEGFVTTGRYLRDVTVWRAEIDRLFASFELGDFGAMALGGEGGVGKSTILVRYAEDRLAAGDVVLFYRASALEGVALGDRIRRDLGVGTAFFEDLLAAAHAPMQASGRRVRVLVDGVNEHADPAALVGAIDALVKQAESYPWFRVVATVRSSAYERLDARFGRLSPQRWVLSEERRGAEVVKGTTVPIPQLEAGEVSDLYERYRSGVRGLRPLTAITDLDVHGSTRALLRNPLLMRLILAAFHGRELPSQLGYDEVMALYLDQVVAERASPNGPRPERVAFLRALVRELDARGAARIARDELYDVPRMAEAMRVLDRRSPYVQLVELGVLIESWSDDVCYVRVAFDRLFEYLLAQLHTTAGESLDALIEAAHRARAFPSLAGALSFLVLRAVREQRVELLAEALDACGAAGEASAVLESTAVTVLEHLVRARHPQLDRVIAALTRTPSTADVTTLIKVVDRAIFAGELEAAELLSRGAFEVAEVLGRVELRAEALFRIGQLQHQRGRLMEAEATYARARDIASDLTLRHRIDVVHGELLRVRGDGAAVELLERAASALHDAGALADAAEARRQHAIALGARGQLQRRTELLEEALAWARESGDTLVQTRCLLSKGVTAFRAGDGDGAERALREALTGAESIGHLRTIGLLACNLGNVLYRDRGDLGGARDAYARYLAMSERLGDRLGAATAVHNLAQLDRVQGDLASAESRYRRALAAFEELGDRESVPGVLDGLGVVLRMAGKRLEAAESHRRALDVARVLSDTPTEEEALWFLSNLALDDEDDREAGQRVAELSALETGTPNLPVRLAALAVRRAARGTQLEVLRAACTHLREAQQSVGELEVDDRPIEAWLDAAQAFARGSSPAEAEDARQQGRRAMGATHHDRLAELTPAS